MAWIKLEQAVFTHRKTMAMAAALEIHPAQAVGHIAALWAWGIDNAPDGRLPNSDVTIAYASLWNGPPGRFVQSLIHSGFVDDDMDGHLTIHDFDEYAGPLLKQREAAKARMKEYRAKQKRS